MASLPIQTPSHPGSRRPGKGSIASGVPVFGRIGLPDIHFDTMAGLYAPPGLSEEKISVLVDAMRKVFADDKFLAAANQAGISLRPLEPAEFLKVSSEVFSMAKGMEQVLKP